MNKEPIALSTWKNLPLEQQLEALRENSYCSIVVSKEDGDYLGTLLTTSSPAMRGPLQRRYITVLELNGIVYQITWKEYKNDDKKLGRMLAKRVNVTEENREAIYNMLMSNPHEGYNEQNWHLPEEFVSALTTPGMSFGMERPTIYTLWAWWFINNKDAHNLRVFFNDGIAPIYKPDLTGADSATLIKLSRYGRVPQSISSDLLGGRVNLQDYIAVRQYGFGKPRGEDQIIVTDLTHAAGRIETYNNIIKDNDVIYHKALDEDVYVVVQKNACGRDKGHVWYLNTIGLLGMNVGLLVEDDTNSELEAVMVDFAKYVVAAGNKPELFAFPAYEANGGIDGKFPNLINNNVSMMMRNVLSNFNYVNKTSLSLGDYFTSRQRQAVFTLETTNAVIFETSLTK